MCFRSVALIIVSIAGIFCFGCGGSNSNVTVNSSSGNGNGTGNSPLETKASTPEPITNNAPTLTPVVKAYCEAWAKNDEAALKKIFSKDTMAYFEADMKEEKEKSFLKYMELDKISGTPCEARNEKINGDTANVIIVADKYPNGYPFTFVKENGEWKMTNKYVNLDSPAGTQTSTSPAKPSK